MPLIRKLLAATLAAAALGAAAVPACAMTLVQVVRHNKAVSTATSQCRARFPSTCHRVSATQLPILNPTLSRPYYEYGTDFYGYTGKREVHCRAYADVNYWGDDGYAVAPIC